MLSIKLIPVEELIRTKQASYTYFGSHKTNS